MFALLGKPGYEARRKELEEMSKQCNKKMSTHVNKFKEIKNMCFKRSEYLQKSFLHIFIQKLFVANPECR